MNTETLTEYIRLDKELSKLNKQSKDIRQQKKLLEQSITSYMIEHNESEDPSILPEIELAGVCLSLKKFKPKKKINQGIIKEILNTSTSEEPENVDKILDELFNNEEEEDIYILKSKMKKK